MRSFLIGALLVLSFRVQAQEEPWNGKKYYFYEVNGTDTTYGTILPDLTITESNTRYQVLLATTRRRVQRTLALANYVADLYRNYNDSLEHIQRKRTQKKYLKSEKKRLFDQFDGIIREMTVNEGKVFTKLVYRQAGVPTYDIIRDLQGSMKAMFWQTLSRTGGANLKLTYDPKYADKLIEDVMKEIESGKTKPAPLPQSAEEYRAMVH